MTRAVKITVAVIVGAVVVLGAFDIAMVALFGKEATISVVVTKCSHSYPIIPFAFGVLMGHFFAQNSEVEM